MIPLKSFAFLLNKGVTPPANAGAELGNFLGSYRVFELVPAKLRYLVPLQVPLKGHNANR